LLLLVAPSRWSTAVPRLGAFISLAHPFVGVRTDYPGEAPGLYGSLALPSFPTLSTLMALKLVRYLSLRAQYIVQCHDPNRSAVLVRRQD
jgi:hypothetical protein